MTHPTDPRRPPSPYLPVPPPGKARGAAPVVIAIAAILVFLVGGVLTVVLLSGGDDGLPTAGGGESSATTDSTTRPTSATTPVTRSTTNGGTAAPSPASQPTSTERARYCEKMGALQVEFTKFRTSTITDSDLDGLVAILDELTPIAPAEVAPDLNTFRGGLSSLQGLLDELDITFDQFQDVAFLTDAAEKWTPDQRQQVENVTTELTDPAFVSAGTKLDTDFRTRC